MRNNAIFLLLLFIFYFILIISYNIFSINKKNVDTIYKDKKYNRIRKILMKEVTNCKNSYSNRLFKLFRKRSNLLIFNKMLISNEILYDNYNCYNIIEKFDDTFNELSIYYMGKDNLSKSYYAYSLSLYNLVNNASYSFLFSCLTKGDSLCMHNAFNTICVYSNLDKLRGALNILNDRCNDFNVDLISLFLTRYKGDRYELADVLKLHFSNYVVNLELCIIKYFFNIKYDCGSELFNFLRKKNTSRDLRLELIRYYKIVKFDDVREYLYGVVNGSRDLECVVLAIDTLSNYKCDDTYSVLRSKVDDSNYLVSYQAVRSLLILDGYDEFDGSFEDNIIKTIGFIKDKR